MTAARTPVHLRPLVLNWRESRSRVECAIASKGPRVGWAALHELGAVDATLAVYYDVCCRHMELSEAQRETLEVLAGIAECLDEADDVTANDVLAIRIVEDQAPPGPSGLTGLSYWGESATRHAWMVAAAGISAVDLSRHPSPVRYEDLKMLAALRGVRVPPLAPGEEFEPPSGVFTHSFQEVMRFPGGWSRSRERRLVSRPESQQALGASSREKG
jgi:hypothetical protein